MTEDHKRHEALLDDAVDHVVREVELRDLSSVVLVGHGWGGYPVTGAAHRLSRVVYYNAPVPLRGTSMSGENAAYADIMREAIEASSDGSISISLENVQQSLMQDQDLDAQKLLFELLVPHPGGYMLDALDVDTVTAVGIPASYILSEDDRALARPGSEFAAQLELTPVLVPGSHESLLTHPDQVAQALIDCVKTDH